MSAPNVSMSVAAEAATEDRIQTKVEQKGHAQNSENKGSESGLPLHGVSSEEKAKSGDYIVILDIPGQIQDLDISHQAVKDKNSRFSVTVTGNRDRRKGGTIATPNVAATPSVPIGRFSITLPLRKDADPGSMVPKFTHGCLELKYSSFIPTMQIESLPQRQSVSVQPSAPLPPPKPNSVSVVDWVLDIFTKKSPDPVTRYDVVVAIDDLATLLETNLWKINLREGLFPKTSANPPVWKVKGAVAISGLFNRGKTFLLNRIAQRRLPSGSMLNTDGISLLKVDEELTLIDSAGQFVPVDTMSESNWGIRTSTEGLIKQLVLDLANMHIVVVNELTWPDQLYVDEVQRIIGSKKQTQKKESEIVVVHNLRDLCYSQLAEYVDSNVLPFYKGCKISGINLVKETPESKSLASKLTPAPRWFLSSDTGTRHVFLCNDDEEFGKANNGLVFALLDEWIYGRMGMYSDWDVFERLLSSLNLHLKDYLVGIRPEDQVQAEYFVQDGGLCIRLAGFVKDKFGLKQTNLPLHLIAAMHTPNSITPAHLVFDYSVTQSGNQVAQARRLQIPTRISKWSNNSSSISKGKGGSESSLPIRAQEKKTPTDGYDIIVDIPDLVHISDGTWSIDIDKSLVKDESTLFQKEEGLKFSGRVAVSGLFNKGKTFVLNLIAGLDLDSSYYTRTKGLSFKNPKVLDLAGLVMLIDSAGQFVPVEKIDDNHSWANRIGTETLTKQVLLSLANYHIVVVNELTWPDQLYITELVQITETSPDCLAKEVIVVHNLKSITDVQELNQYREHNIQPFYPQGQAKKIMKSDVYCFESPETKTRHVFLMNNRSKEGQHYNSIVAMQLRIWIGAVAAGTPAVNIIEYVRKTLSTHLKSYIQYKTGSKPNDSELKSEDLPELTFKPHTAPSEGRIKRQIAFDDDKQPSVEAKPVSLPRGLVTGIYADECIVPPYLIFAPDDANPNLQIMLDLPGIKARGTDVDNFELSFNMEKYALTVSGVRSSRPHGRAVTTTLGARNPPCIRFGPFSISIPLLDFSVKPTVVSAVIDNGCLTITMEMVDLAKKVKAKAADMSPAVSTLKK